jgi:hypothetical protein
MPRLGRPALPEEEVRKALIGVRVREDERDLVRRAADAAGKSMSDWAREILVREARKQAPKGNGPSPLARKAGGKGQGGNSPRSRKDT